MRSWFFDAFWSPFPLAHFWHQIDSNEHQDATYPKSTLSTKCKQNINRKSTATPRGHILDNGWTQKNKKLPGLQRPAKDQTCCTQRNAKDQTCQALQDPNGGAAVSRLWRTSVNIYIYIYICIRRPWPGACVWDILHSSALMLKSCEVLSPLP